MPQIWCAYSIISAAIADGSRQANPDTIAAMPPLGRIRQTAGIVECSKKVLCIVCFRKCGAEDDLAFQDAHRLRLGRPYAGTVKPIA
jgi:hypothetical protein